MNPSLVVIYGTPLVGKTSLAWQLARSLPDKAVVVSVDALLGGAIAVPDADPSAELEMVHVQLRLLVANYLKNRYHAVIEGPFLFERAGALLSYEADLDQLVALMRHLAQQSLIVRLTASDEVISQRASAAGREAELAAALRVGHAYRTRYGERFRSLRSTLATRYPAVRR